MKTPSQRILEAVDALPLRPGMRVLEIGCGPGAAARLVAERIGRGYVLAIDRSPAAIAQAIKGSSALTESGRLEFRTLSIEDLVLVSGERPFDLAFALRVGALDGRHPKSGELALSRLRRVLKRGAPLYIDGGTPLRTVDIFGEDA